MAKVPVKVLKPFSVRGIILQAGVIVALTQHQARAKVVQKKAAFLTKEELEAWQKSQQPPAKEPAAAAKKSTKKAAPKAEPASEPEKGE